MTALYPATIDGYVQDAETCDVQPLVARRTGEVEDGCEVYQVDVPMPGAWMAAGRLALGFDMVPGRSPFRLQFESSS